MIYLQLLYLTIYHFIITIYILKINETNSTINPNFSFHFSHSHFHFINESSIYNQSQKEFIYLMQIKVINSVIKTNNSMKHCEYINHNELYIESNFEKIKSILKISVLFSFLKYNFLIR